MKKIIIFSLVLVFCIIFFSKYYYNEYPKDLGSETNIENTTPTSNPNGVSDIEEVVGQTVRKVTPSLTLRGNYLYHDGTNDKGVFIHDPENLIYLGFCYLKDKKYVYSICNYEDKDNRKNWKSGIVQGLNPSDIIFYSDNKTGSSYGPFMIKNSVLYYFDGEGALEFSVHKIGPVSVSDFKIVEFPLVTDGENVYYKHFKLDLDSVSLNSKFVVFGYIMDDKSVFYNAKFLEGADPVNFKIINEEGRYFTDGERVYSFGSILEDVDVDDFYTIKLEDYIFGTDGVNMYYHYTKMDGLNPKTAYAENLGRGGLEMDVDAVIIRDEDTFWATHCNNFSCRLVLLEDEHAYEEYKINNPKVL